MDIVHDNALKSSQVPLTIPFIIVSRLFIKEFSMYFNDSIDFENPQTQEEKQKCYLTFVKLKQSLRKRKLYFKYFQP